MANCGLGAGERTALRAASLIGHVLAYAVYFWVLMTCMHRLWGIELTAARLVVDAFGGLLASAAVVVPWGDIGRRLWNSRRRSRWPQ